MVVYHSGGQGISHNCIRCVKWYTVKNLWLRTLLWPFQRFVIQHVNNMLTDQRSLVGSLFTVCETFKDGLWVSQPRLSRGKRESGQILIRLLYCILSSRVPNEVGVNINWDTFCKGRSSVSPNNMPKKATARLHLSLTQLTRQEILGVLETRWWWEIDQTLSAHVRVWAARLRSAVDLPYGITMESSCWEKALYRNQVSYPPIHLQRQAVWPWRWDGQRQHGGHHESCPSLVPPADEAASSSEWLHQAPSSWGLLIVWSLPGKKERGGDLLRGGTYTVGRREGGGGGTYTVQWSTL